MIRPGREKSASAISVEIRKSEITVLYPVQRGISSNHQRITRLFDHRQMSQSFHDDDLGAGYQLVQDICCGRIDGAVFVAENNQSGRFQMSVHNSR